MLNMDFEQRVVIETQYKDWEQSPAQGVWRKRLAREDAEQGHATSIVRYDPGAKFSSHPHPKGEEILVLSGTFSDHRGDFGAGSYLRNPEGYEHAPFSKEGCTLLVKLHQFHDRDRKQVTIDTRAEPWQQGQGNLRVMPLHEFEGEHVALVHWPKGEQFVFHRHAGGEEIYVMSGKLADEHGEYPSGTWIRSPHLSTHQPFAIEETVIWVKIGHLCN
jgi:anti-sigma factor ChrR (cupin superfamily)